MLHKLAKPVFLVILMLVFLACTCSSEVTPKMVATAGSNNAEAANPTVAAGESTPQADTPEPTTGKTTFNTNDVIRIGDFTVIVLGWDNLEPNEYTKPDEGNKFIAVELLIVNAGKTTEYVSSLLQMYLKDDTGQKYDMDFGTSMLMKYDMSNYVVPGERVLGGVGFQIPQGAKGLVFVFDESVWSTGKLFVNLSPEPGISDPPARVEGEVPPNAMGIGEKGTIGKLSITVNSIFTPDSADYFKPDEGYEYLGVDLTIENTGSESVNVSSFLQMYLKDPLGHVIDVNVFASSSAGTSPEGEISAGEKVKGQIGFQILKGSTGLLFVFDDAMNKNDKLFFKIN